MLFWKILFGRWAREMVLTYGTIFGVPLKAYLIWPECLFKTELSLSHWLRMLEQVLNGRIFLLFRVNANSLSWLSLRKGTYQIEN